MPAARITLDSSPSSSSESFSSRVWMLRPDSRSRIFSSRVPNNDSIPREICTLSFIYGDNGSRRGGCGEQRRRTLTSSNDYIRKRHVRAKLRGGSAALPGRHKRPHPEAGNSGSAGLPPRRGSETIGQSPPAFARPPPALPGGGGKPASRSQHEDGIREIEVRCPRRPPYGIVACQIPYRPFFDFRELSIAHVSPPSPIRKASPECAGLTYGMWRNE